MNTMELGLSEKQLRLDRLLSLYCFQPLCSSFSEQPGRVLPILMYHSISDEPETGITAYFQTRTKPAVFAQQMKFLRANGYIGMDLETGLQHLKNPTTTDLKPVVLTFDDGYKDFYTHAFPILNENNFTATVFLATGYVGESRHYFEGMPCMTWQDVKQLHCEGIRFGSHTVTHPMLYKCGWSQIQKELCESRKQIEGNLQTSVTTFCYPHAYPRGDELFVNRFTEMLKQAGYACCTTTSIGRVKKNANLFSLNRLPVNSLDDSKLLNAKLSGGYDWLKMPQTLFKKGKTVWHWLRCAN